MPPDAPSRPPVRIAAALCLLAVLLVPPAARAADLVVFAAASLKNALDEIVPAFEAQTGATVAVSLAGSSALARQIERGAPADVFISANRDWMDVLEADGLIDPATRFDLAGNALVVVAHGPDAPPLALGPQTDLAARLDGRPLAMALVDAVPAGLYGKAALRSLGLWEKLAPHVAETDNVRAALALVALGEAPLGIVYLTDAAAEDDVSVVARFPPGSHAPIVYPAAAVRAGEVPLARRFLAHLAGEDAGRALRRQGFTVPGE